MDRPITGGIEVTREGWLHIQLNALLPHCKYGSVSAVEDAIHTLLNGYFGRLPHFERAFLFIDEYSNRETQNVYDQDNKGWKSVGNALKGRIYPDDDQYTLSICLLSKQSKDAVCHIYVTPQEDGSRFLERREKGYACTPM